ncbi:MAG TPA: FAD-binding oxidoreductase [Dehalococcoidia bacterium]|nr:FAD-binding oxidoreductase [Dehalococcoidia bacterium]
MVDLQVVTTSGTQSVLEEAAVEGFGTSLRGQLIRPEDHGYDDARQVWNGMIDKKPALIVRCAGVADVLAAVNFARDNNLLVAVRGGGHNITGNAVCDGGIVIDLSPMKSVRIDPVKRTARADAGLTWGEYNHETQAFGLASTGGVISTTGISGLTLGGGLGWLMSKHGLTCDNLISADIVTANGQFLTASASENQELFWGLRGGGGNFGVVTSFEYQLHPVGPVLAGMVIHPMAKAKEVLQFYRDYARSCPDELTAFAALMTSPDGDPVVSIIVAYIGPIEEGERLMEPVKTFGPPVADTIGPMSYCQVNAMLDGAFPYGGVHRYWKSSFLETMSNQVIDTVIDRAAALPTPTSMIGFFHMHGAASRVGPDETAFGLRQDQWDYDFIAQWDPPVDPQKYIQWVREAWTAMEPFATGGVYVNHLDAEEADRIQAAYGSNYERLLAIKNKYDPTNLFRLNQNIRPAG